MKNDTGLKGGPKKHRVFLLEDHPVTGHGFTLLLNQESNLVVCGRAAAVAAALKEIETLKPDIAIVDIALPGRDGIEFIKDVSARHPLLPTLALSTLDELIYAERALRAGAKGYIMKQEPVELLLQAVHQVLAGEIYLSEAMRAHLFQKSMSASPDNNHSNSNYDQLTDREIEVFRLIGEGLGTRQIAERLCLSISTVETHRTHLKDKLGLKRAHDLVRHAVEWLRSQNFKP